MDQLHKEVTALIVLFATDCALLLFNLVFALYISARYFCRLHVRGPFIILFYVFVDLTTVFRLIEMVFILVELVQHDAGKTKIVSLFTEKKVEYCRSIAYVAFLGVGLVVVSTMFQIGLSLQVVSSEIDAAVAQRRARCFYSAASLIMVLASGVEVFLHIYYDEDLEDIRLNKIFDTLWYTLVTALYIIVICFLVGQLKKINEEELHSEKMSIIRQFGIFLAGYVAWTVYIIIEYFNPTQYAFFVDQVSLAISVILWDVVPVTYMLFVHHRTFRSMIRQLALSESENPGIAKITGEVGYLRVGSLNTSDSKHVPTFSDQASGATGRSQKTPTRSAMSSRQSTLSINSYERHTMAEGGAYSFLARGDASSSLRVTARELHINDITQLDS